jgi:hypothetical protein
VQIKAARGFENAMKFNQARRHHREVSHHRGMFEEGLQRFHQLNDRDVCAGIDELTICVRGIGPAPSIGEGVELRLAHLPARLAKKDVVIGIRVKRRIEINKIDAGVKKFFPVGKPFQIIAEV